MSFDIGVIPILMLMVLGALPQFYIVRLLSKEVSREKLNEAENVSALWKNTIPPSEVLTEKGLKIKKWYLFYVVAVVLLSGLIGVYVTGFSISPISVV